MKVVPYALGCASLMYAMLCTRPDIYFTVGMVSQYQSNPGQEHWSAVKTILKYLRRTKEYMLVHKSSDLLPLGYTDSDFQTDKDKRKSTSGCVFTLGGGVVIWMSVKHKCIVDSTMKAEYVAASEAAKEAIWFRNFLLDLNVVPNLPRQFTIYCDNTSAVENTKELRAH
ncbi:secreted RxLR effector protein 161-like [Apium graveolens]|uniref:secreted RxLR effector protein 161-like n=1 Tax=Apium graveolens TaxID=4045 RepID=UPI003D7A6ABD